MKHLVLIVSALFGLTSAGLVSANTQTDQGSGALLRTLDRITGEVIDYDPNKLLADYTKQQQSIDTLRSQLKDVLGAALSANTTEGK